MDIGENIFKKIWRFGSSFPQRFKKDADNKSVVTLEEVRHKLLVIGRALTGEYIDIRTAEHEGGASGADYFMPAKFNRYETRADNELFFLFRLIFMGVQSLKKLDSFDDSDIDIEEARTRAFNLSEQTLSIIKSEYPGFRNKLERVMELESAINEGNPSTWYWLWGKWMPPPRLSNKAMLAAELGPHKDGSLSPQTEMEGLVREKVEILEVDKKAIEDFTLSHSFEKVDTLDDFNGNWRDLCGNDDLEDHSDALEELEMRQVVRVHEPVHSVMRSQIRIDTGIYQANKNNHDKGIPLDEWDYKRRKYKKSYCQLFPSMFRETKPGFALETLNKERRLITELRRKFARILNERELVRRSSFGEELDLDAMVQSHAEISAGRSPLENIFLNKRKKSVNLAVQILVDISLSTDAYVEDQQILSLEQRALVVFGEVLEEFGAQFAIDCFYSETRSHCNYLHVKTFDERWIEVRDRLGAISPRAYTRIGPAVRYSTRILSQW